MGDRETDSMEIHLSHVVRPVKYGLLGKLDLIEVTSVLKIDTWCAQGLGVSPDPSRW
jgi:hypothetical protein